MSRPSAEYVRQEPPTQPFDVVGLVAGVLFAFAGLAYLFGGHKALSGHSSLVLPLLLVLVGVAGLASSGLVRRSWFSRTPPVAADGPDGVVDGAVDAEATAQADEEPRDPYGG